VRFALTKYSREARRTSALLRARKSSQLQVNLGCSRPAQTTRSMGRTTKRKAKKPATTASTGPEFGVSGSTAAASTSIFSPTQPQPRRNASEIAAEFVAGVESMTIGGPTPEQREVLASIAAMITNDPDRATKELATQKYYDLMVEIGGFGNVEMPVDSNGESLPLRFLKELALGPDYRSGTKAAGGSSTAPPSQPAPAAASPPPEPRHSEPAATNFERVEGVRDSVLRRIEKWIFFGPNDPDLREANFCARHILINAEIHTEDEVLDAWNDFFDTLHDCQLPPSTLDDIRDHHGLREHILHKFDELKGKCTCTDCDDVDLKQIKALGDGAVYSRADLDDEERDEIWAARRYNGWFDLKPMKPSPSDRKALLHLANRRRTQWDEFPGVATSLRLWIAQAVLDHTLARLEAKYVVCLSHTRFSVDQSSCSTHQRDARHENAQGAVPPLPNHFATGYVARGRLLVADARRNQQLTPFL
jgi:hypothetical protein